MFEENKEILEPNTDLTDSVTELEETSLMLPSIDLNEQSLALIEQIIAEPDKQKAAELTQLFNENQNKKTMVRVNKLSDLLDTITEQALTRFTARPDEISNKELFDGLKIVQDLIERGQKQVSGPTDTPLIQFNQQTNEVNIGSAGSELNRESRERVKNAVLGLLNSISNSTQTALEVEDSDIVTVEEKAQESDLNGQ